MTDVRLACGRTSRGHTEGSHTGFLVHLPAAVLALTFLARRLRPFLSLVDREIEFCVLTYKTENWHQFHAIYLPYPDEA